MNSLLRSFCLLSLLASGALGQGSSTGVSSLKIPSSALHAALGSTAGTQVATLGAVSANPASMVFPDDRLALQFTHTAWIQGISSDHLLVSFLTRIGRLSIATGMTSVPDIEVRTQPGPPASTFTARTASLGLGWGSEVSQGILLGISASYIYDRLYSVEASGFGISAGLLATQLAEGVTVGGSVGNLGSLSGYSGNASSDLPRAIRVGASYRHTIDDFTFEPAISYQNVSSGASGIVVGASLGYGFMRVHGSWRAGETAQSGSVGASISYRGINIDYALLPFSSGLGNGHLITVALDL